MKRKLDKNMSKYIELGNSQILPNEKKKITLMKIACFGVIKGNFQN